MSSLSTCVRTAISIASLALPPHLTAAESHLQESRLTHENYDKIQLGMSREEVKEILGPNQSSAGSGTNWTLTWHVGADRTHHIEIHFSDGRVASKHSTMEWAKPALRKSAEPARPQEKLQETTKESDKISAALANLRATNEFKRERALAALAQAEFDESRAPEVSRAIQQCLIDKQFGVRNEAEKAIRKWATHENAEYFLRIVKTKVDPRRATDRPDQLELAVEILVQLREPQAVAPIASLLTRFFDRDTAVKALKKLGPDLAENEVLKYANDKDYEVAAAAREVLSDFKTSPAARLTQCLADLKSSAADKRLWAAQQIEKIDLVPARRKEVALALEPLLADKFGFPAHAAAAALVKWGVPENEPAFVKALAHASPDMRRLACDALARIGSQKCLEALKKATADRDPSVAKAAHSAIDAINGRC
jgi:HEAT repeat protein